MDFFIVGPTLHYIGSYLDQKHSNGLQSLVLKTASNSMQVFSIKSGPTHMADVNYSRVVSRFSATMGLINASGLNCSHFPKKSTR